MNIKYQIRNDVCKRRVIPANCVENGCAKLCKMFCDVDDE